VIYFLRGCFLEMKCYEPVRPGQLKYVFENDQSPILVRFIYSYARGSSKGFTMFGEKTLLRIQYEKRNRKIDVSQNDREESNDPCDPIEESNEFIS